MEKVHFKFGSEKQFFDFISHLNERGKIALISHIDLDGLASAKVVSEVVQPDIIRFIEYSDMDMGLVLELREEKVKKIIFTDISLRDRLIVEKLEEFADVLIIDHHPSNEDFNSWRTVYMQAENYCAAYLSYYLFFKIQDVSKYDWLVACACLSDWTFARNVSWLEETYQVYEQKFPLKTEELKRGIFWDRQFILSLYLIYFRENFEKAFYSIKDSFESVESIRPYALDVLGEIRNSLKLFEKQKERINRGYFWEISSRFPIKELVINILCNRKKDATFIIAERKEGYYKFAARRFDAKFNVADYLRSLVEGFSGSSGGGHAHAAGGYVLLSDALKFKEKVKHF